MSPELIRDFNSDLHIGLSGAALAALGIDGVSGSRVIASSIRNFAVEQPMLVSDLAPAKL